jgi:hypothetical protein
MNMTTTTHEPTDERAGSRVPPRLGFAAVVILWLTFGVALAAMPAALDSLWAAIRGLWSPLQTLVWLLFLPWILGLWAWQAAWPVALRLLLIAGLAVATAGAFVPRRQAGS